MTHLLGSVGTHMGTEGYTTRGGITNMILISQITEEPSGTPTDRVCLKEVVLILPNAVTL